MQRSTAAQMPYHGIQLPRPKNALHTIVNVGIITFHFCYNYGAALQCLALSRAIAKLGHKVEVVNFHPTCRPHLHAWQGWGLRKAGLIHNIRKRWVDFRYGSIVRGRFDKFFADNLVLSRHCEHSSVSDVVQSYDALIVGSDQVWNQSYYNASPVYFLQFSPDYRGRRISYAACCGSQDALPGTSSPSVIASALRRFDSISIRNDITQRCLNSIVQLPSSVVCDPTLLDDWNRPEDFSLPPHRNYILAYILGSEIEGGHQNAIDRIRNLVGNLPVVWVCSSAHKPETYCRWADHLECACGPLEWMSLIRNASFVYTDSFHGVLFSMQFHKQFFAYFSELMRAGRLLDVADRYKVGSLIAASIADAEGRGCFVGSFDYGATDECIAQHRQFSIQFLRTSLQ